jgi:hypothetical protein
VTSCVSILSYRSWPRTLELSQQFQQNLHLILNRNASGGSYPGTLAIRRGCNSELAPRNLYKGKPGVGKQMLMNLAAITGRSIVSRWMAEQILHLYASRTAIIFVRCAKKNNIMAVGWWAHGNDWRTNAARPRRVLHENARMRGFLGW